MPRREPGVVRDVVRRPGVVHDELRDDGVELGIPAAQALVGTPFRAGDDRRHRPVQVGRDELGMLKVERSGVIGPEREVRRRTRRRHPRPLRCATPCAGTPASRPTGSERDHRGRRAFPRATPGPPSDPRGSFGSPRPHSRYRTTPRDSSAGGTTESHRKVHHRCGRCATNLRCHPRRRSRGTHRPAHRRDRRHAAARRGAAGSGTRSARSSRHCTMSNRRNPSCPTCSACALAARAPTRRSTRASCPGRRERCSARGPGPTPLASTTGSGPRP